MIESCSARRSTSARTRPGCWSPSRRRASCARSWSSAPTRASRRTRSATARSPTRRSPRSREVVATQVRLAEELGAEAIRIVATAAIREAKNREQVARRSQRPPASRSRSSARRRRAASPSSARPRRSAIRSRATIGVVDVGGGSVGDHPRHGRRRGPRGALLQDRLRGAGRGVPHQRPAVGRRDPRAARLHRRLLRGASRSTSPTRRSRSAAAPPRCGPWSARCSSTRRSSARSACSPATRSPTSPSASSSTRAGCTILPAGVLILEKLSELLGQPLQIGKGGLREGVILDLLHDAANGAPGRPRRLSPSRYARGVAKARRFPGSARTTIRARGRSRRDPRRGAGRARPRDVLDIGDIERVHDMRVATRRLRAALEVFEPCFPKKRLSAALSEVKALADALGERRDRDVTIAALDASTRRWGRRPARRAQPHRALARRAGRGQRGAGAIRHRRPDRCAGRLDELSPSPRAEPMSRRGAGPTGRTASPTGASRGEGQAGAQARPGGTAGRERGPDRPDASRRAALVRPRRSSPRAGRAARPADRRQAASLRARGDGLLLRRAGGRRAPRGPATFRTCSASCTTAT